MIHMTLTSLIEQQYTRHLYILTDRRGYTGDIRQLMWCNVYHTDPEDQCLGTDKRLIQKNKHIYQKKCKKCRLDSRSRHNIPHVFPTNDIILMITD